jgi:hypothetical protein
MLRMKLVRVLTAALLLAAVSTAGVAPALAGSSRSRALDASSRILLNSAPPGVATVAEPVPAPATDTVLPAQAATSAPPIATGRVLVKLKGASSSANLAHIAQDTHASVSGVRDVHAGRLKWGVPSGRSAEQFAQQLVDSGQVEYAVPDYVRQLVNYTPPAYLSPSDPFFTDTSTWHGYIGSRVVETYAPGGSWWLRDIRAPQAWAEAYTGASITGKYPLRASGTAITVAVIDSGLYSAHEDAGANIVGGRDFFDHQEANGAFVQDNDVTPVDPSVMPTSTYGPVGGRERTATASHGTCVAGEIGATASNGVGSVGVGYDTRVVVHKVMGVFRDGQVGIDDGAVIDAIYYSADNGAKVISMSFGGYDYSQALADAINYAREKGVVVVAAKGNDARNAGFYPAANAGVVSVGALDRNAGGASVPADFTNYFKTSLDIMAPGSFIWGFYQPGVQPDADVVPPSYAVWDGTSMAAPIVSGAIAWLWRAAPALSATEITNVVLGSASTHGAATHFPSGYRSLDMYAAYSKLKATYPLLTKPFVADETVASVGNTTLQWGTSQAAVRGVTYDVSINGSPAATATTASGAQFPLVPGDYTVGVAEHSAYNWDDGTANATGTVHVIASAAGAAAWSPTHVTGGSAVSAVPGYHRSVTFESTLRDASSTPLAGGAPKLQSSSNGATWATVAGTPVAELANGVYRASVAPEDATYYRFSFATTDNVGGTISSAFLVKPGVSLTTPASKSSQSHSKKLAVTGTLKPAHGTSSRVVHLKIYRWNGKQWAGYSSAWTRVTYRGSYSSYSASIGLKKGGYRIYAVANADAKHSSTWSGYKSVTIK